MEITQMNAQAQETAQEMKQRFPELTDEQIIKLTGIAQILKILANNPMTVAQS